jgi:hypothetical protein
MNVLNAAAMILPSLIDRETQRQVMGDEPIESTMSAELVVELCDQALNIAEVLAERAIAPVDEELEEELEPEPAPEPETPAPAPEPPAVTDELCPHGRSLASWCIICDGPHP